jgi:hypothetical protein
MMPLGDRGLAGLQLDGEVPPRRHLWQTARCRQASPKIFAIVLLMSLGPTVPLRSASSPHTAVLPNC